MDAGEGPGEELTHLIGLQKEPGEQQNVAHPHPAAQGEGSGVPSYPRDTGAMHDIQPAATPMGDPPLLVETDSHRTKSPPKKTIERPERASPPPPPAAASQTSMREAIPPVVSRRETIFFGISLNKLFGLY
jgi:hypothetical protein